jgi:hypothetical protein
MLSSENIKAIISECESSLKVKFTQLEAESVLRFIKKLNQDTLKKVSESGQATVVNFVVDKYLRYIREAKNYDTKEMLKEQMNVSVTDSQKYETSRFSNGVSSFDNSLVNDAESLRTITRVINRDSLMRDVNILIDSRYQNLSNQDRSKVSFNIVSETKNKSEGSGAIIASTSLKDIVEIEVYPFSIPYFSDADNYYKKITMSILELSASSIDAYDDSQFHFIFDTEKRANLIYLNPINKVFKFHKPIAKLGELTLRFGSPLAPLTFEQDRLQTKSVSYANPMVIEFNESHNLLSGDIIYFNDFETLDNARDLAIISEITTTKGHICSRIDSMRISINVDGTKVQLPDINRQFLIYLGSKRILIPMRLRFID